MVCHNYIFFSSKDSLHSLSRKARNEYIQKFLSVLASDKNVISHTYSTLGLKKDATILIWFQADSVDTIQNLLNKLMHTGLGRHLQITHTLFGMTRQSQYSPHGGHMDTERKGRKYLIIYPFTKTTAWYQLDSEERRKLMEGHMGIGKKHASKIDQLLLYSYGIDDSEFIVSYEADDLAAFQTLVMELRSDKVREYTLKDTPIFTCIYKAPEEAMTFL